MHVISLDLTPKQLCELSVVWYNAMRRLGFTPEEIFFSPHVVCSTGQVVWGVIVKAEGKVWSGAIGRSTEDSIRFWKRWQKYAANEMQQMTDDQMQVLWQQCMPLELFTNVIASIALKGLPMRDL
jgi:hypothetical protein